MMVRPSRKQKKVQEETMSNLAPGDSVLTTSGFYGTIVAINGDTVIVEFGNNKNCRIPMSKQAISQVEKAGSGTGDSGSSQAGSSSSSSSEPRKKFSGKKKAAQEEAQAKAEAEAAKKEADFVDRND